MIPHELVSRYVIPYVKALVAHELSRKGVSQVKVAENLSLSQPMVSKYLSTSEEDILSKLTDLGIPLTELRGVVDAMANSLLRGDKEAYLRLFTVYANSLLGRGYLCRKHLMLVKELPADCNICMEFFSTGNDVIAEEVREIYKSISGLDGIHNLVPEVGMNIVAAESGASNVMDVVGFPGRIFKVGSRLKAMEAPQRGGSRHTATILLEVMKRWPHIRYAVVTRYYKECVEALQRRNYVIGVSGPHRSKSEVLNDLRRDILSLERQPNAIADLGGPGLEPVIYLLGSKPSEVIDLVRTCVDEVNTLLRRR
jgi:predicted fused transcriptional regulator/phosphomethylpyrimidine kinase/predicted transcriptional regulator